MNLNMNELRRPKLPIVLAYLNSIIDKSTLWSPPKKKESNVAIKQVEDTDNGVSVTFDPEEGDRLPEPVIADSDEIVQEVSSTEEVSVDINTEEVEKPEEASGFVIKEL